MDGEHKVCSCEYPPVPHCPCSQRENCVLVPLMAENARLLARVGELEAWSARWKAAAKLIREERESLVWVTQQQGKSEMAALDERDQAMARVGELEGEIERLREAITENTFHEVDEYTGVCLPNCWRCVLAAHADGAGDAGEE